MHGTEDNRVSYEIGVEVAERLRNSTFYTFENKGHLPVTTATGEFCEVLRQFVRTGTVPAPPGAGK